MKTRSILVVLALGLISFSSCSKINASSNHGLSPPTPDTPCPCPELYQKRAGAMMNKAATARASFA